MVNVKVFGLSDLFKMAKEEVSYDVWYGFLKASKEQKAIVTNLVDKAKEHSNKIFKSLHAVWDEKEDTVELYRFPCRGTKFTHVLTKKEVLFQDFTSWIMDMSEFKQEELCFMTQKNQEDRNFEGAFHSYSLDESWDFLEKLISRDYEKMEEDFLNIYYSDDDSMIVVVFNGVNGIEKYSILRM